MLTRLARGVALGIVILALGELNHPAPVHSPAAALPGAEPYAPELQARLARALAARGRGHTPRTRHRNPEETPRYTNRLILESSPYLVQHAHNPVDWFPWGDEAFARARQQSKPVLLSVGYSTCHWCHVMEEESFDDEEIAAYLNRHYVAIKVDRESRPDVDGVYMAAVHAMGQSGGWPMTLWLTPERRPFYAGTYFPPRDGERGVRFGFLSLLTRLQEIFQQRPLQVAEAAADVATRIEENLAAAPGDAVPGQDVVRQAYAGFRRAFDAEHGGFGRAPKFPRSVQLEFLLRYHRRTGDAEARGMVEKTLESMAAGGIADQVGGGFHRYATDARWLVPHFEKMLYDNALLVVAYLEGYQVTGRTEFARVARDTLAYIQREMTGPGGGFFSATDADSEGVEGTFYLWTPEEMAAVLAPEELRLATAYFAVTPAGNFEGRSILHAPRSLATVAAELGLEEDAARALLDAARARLLGARAQRTPPHTDRKVLAAWNGLMISAFARAAQVLREPAYATVAVRAADFVLENLYRDGRLRRSHLDRRVSGDGYLDDYAFLIAGLLDLYEADFDPRWLRQAIALQAVLTAHYWDAIGGGFFLTADDAEELLARAKPAYDGAEPAGNSEAVLNLLRLAEFTGDDRHRQMAEQALRGLAPSVTAGPTGAPRLLGAVDFSTDKPKEIVIITPRRVAEAESLLARLARTYAPNRVVIVVSEGAALEALATTVPLVGGKTARDGRPTAYVCERRVCDLPTADAEVFARQLARVEPLPAR